VDFDLARGQFLALLGPSGCGKTTTLRMIAGFERPDEGEIEVDGARFFGRGVFVPPERRRVGMVFQDGALFPHMDVVGNIAYGLRGDEDRRARVTELLDLVGLRGLGRRMPHELSGGQMQRVALARALAPRPSLVLLDEPFASLDAGLRARLRTELRAILRRAGVSVILVTHDQDEALSFADSIAVMWLGKLMQRSSPTQLYGAPANVAVASFLGEANLLVGEASAGHVATELGTLLCEGGPEGRVDVLLRPEALRLFLDGRSAIRVTETEYYGHDRVLALELPSGSRIRARVTGECAIHEGDHVRVQVQGGVLCFPADEVWE
jgi:iron(III) transport system ATP-binding protein